MLRNFDYGRGQLRFRKGHINEFQECERNPANDFLREFSYISQPVDYIWLKLYVLVEHQDFNELIRLIPNVEYLELWFCDLSTKYDLLPLLKLSEENGGHLHTIHIRTSRYPERKDVRLRNIDLLVGKFRTYDICEQILTLENPSYVYPKIRNPKLKHIRHITDVNGIKVYNVSILEAHEKYFENVDPNHGWCYYTENMILQIVENTSLGPTYLCFLPQTPHNQSDGCLGCILINLEREKFNNLLFLEADINLADGRYLEYEDLWLDDTDAVE